MMAQAVRTWLRRIGIALAVVAGLGVTAAVLFCVRLLLPISTPAFRDGHGRPLPQSIATIERWRINGVDESVIIRGRDRRNPVLIWLHGGPGSSETPLLRRLNGVLEDHFTVVYWDQRLAGHTLDPSAPPPSRLTVADMVSDLEVLVPRLQARLGKRKVALIGNSWGSTLGVMYAARHPENVSAYVGVGQVADNAAAERASYAFVLDEARKRGEAQALADLRRIGPPPYKGDDVFIERRWLQAMGGVSYRYLSLPQLIWIGLGVSEANWRDLYANDKGGALAYRLLAPELVHINLDHTYTDFTVPFFVVAGRYDHVTDAGLARAYLERLSAPQKGFVLFDRSGHSPHIEEPERFNRWMIETMRPVALAAGG